MPEETNSIYVRNEDVNVPNDQLTEDTKLNSGQITEKDIGRIKDPNIAHELATIEDKLGHDARLRREKALILEAQDGLNKSERFYTEIMDGVQAEYPDAFDLMVASDGSKALLLKPYQRHYIINTESFDYPTIFTKMGIFISGTSRATAETIDLDALQRHLEDRDFKNWVSDAYIPEKLLLKDSSDHNKEVTIYPQNLRRTQIQDDLKNRMMATQKEQESLKAQRSREKQEYTTEKILDNLRP